MRLTLASLSVAVAVVLAACTTSTSTPAAGGSTSPTDQPAISVLSILPPGNVPASGQPAAGKPDERQMYDKLIRADPAALTDAGLSDYYKQAPLDPAPGDVVSTQTPRPGVTIKRDRFGVPYVYGTTDNDTAYGAGYAGTQDRMFVMDALRYAGAGRRSELLGATPANLAADADELRQADYTPQEAQAQLDALAKRGGQGAEIVARAGAFVDGVNAARRAMCPTTAAPTCPPAYRLLKLTPTKYTPADIVYASSLVGGIFGRGGGQEARNALFLRQLQAALGQQAGRAALADLRDATDAGTPVTNPGAYPYGAPGAIDPAAVALPDLPSAGVKLAPGTGGIPPSAQPGGPGAGGASGTGGAGAGSPSGVLQVPPTISNALLVAANHSATGHPIAVMGPQTGYQAPNFFDEIALHGPHQQARGVAFANLQFAVLIGHGASYAWSATSSSGDLVDTVLDRLCNTDGSPATVTSAGYLDDGRCVPMPSRSQVERDGSGKVIGTLPDLRTRHGIVAYRTTAQGTPVAVVSQRSTYGHETESVVGFLQINDPGAIHNARDFTDAFSKVAFTFNWFYADSRDIATYTSGDLPLRPAGVDPDLPRWGDKRWDWTGMLPTAAHPQSVNPPAGYLVSWNNKPSSGTYAADNEWGWGPVQRVLALRDRLQHAIDAGPLTRSKLVGVMADAATVDVRGAYLLDSMLAVVGNDPALARYTSLLKAWRDKGAHRVDRARTGQYTDSGAIALMDAWYPVAAKQVLRPRLGGLVDAVPQSIDNLPSSHLGSAWNNVASYEWVDRDLGALLGQPVATRMSQGYCGKGVLAACRTELRQTLQQAVAALAGQQHTADPSRWTAAKAADEIQFMYVGSTVAPVDRQNRPTFQQVVG